LNRRRFIKYAGSTVVVGAAAAVGAYALVGPGKVLPKPNVTRIVRTTANSSAVTVSAGEGVTLLLEGSVAKVKPSSDIFVVNGTSAQNFGFGALMSLMGTLGSPFYNLSMKNTGQSSEGLIHRDDVIIIKVNSQWDQRGGTNTDLLKEIIGAIE